MGRALGILLAVKLNTRTRLFQARLARTYSDVAYILRASGDAVKTLTAFRPIGGTESSELGSVAGRDGATLRELFGAHPPRPVIGYLRYGAGALHVFTFRASRYPNIQRCSVYPKSAWRCGQGRFSSNPWDGIVGTGVNNSPRWNTARDRDWGSGSTPFAGRSLSNPGHPR